MTTDALAEAVAKAEAQLEREIWIAVRVTSTGEVAFMGAFDSLENAQKRCEFNQGEPFWWHARSQDPDVHEWETGWFPFVEDVDVKFAVALRRVQNHPNPQDSRIEEAT